MRARPFNTIFARTLTLMLSGIMGTLILGLGVLAFSPPPPPRSVSIAWYVHAYRTGHDDRVVTDLTGTAPHQVPSRGQAAALIARSLAGGIGAQANEVRVSIEAPAMFGIIPGSSSGERSHMMIIDVPRSASLPRRGHHLDLGSYLRHETIRVPPFNASVRRPDGRYVRLSPRSIFPTVWQTRILIIFVLSVTAAAPLAWIGARRLTDSVNMLARRMDLTQGHEREFAFPSTGGTREIRRLEHAFAALHSRIQQQAPSGPDCS